VTTPIESALLDMIANGEHTEDVQGLCLCCANLYSPRDSTDRFSTPRSGFGTIDARRDSIIDHHDPRCPFGLLPVRDRAVAHVRRRLALCFQELSALASDTQYRRIAAMRMVRK